MTTCNTLDIPEPVERLRLWLTRFLRVEMLFQAASCTFFGIAGALVLALTSYCSVFVVFFVLLRFYAVFFLMGQDLNFIRAPIVTCLVLLIVILSLIGAQKNRFGMDYSGKKVWYGSRVDGNALKAATKLICEFLFSGPRLLLVAADHFGKLVRLLCIDEAGVTRLLFWIVSHGTKATVGDITSAFPELNAVRILPQLRDIPGVIWLVSNRGVILLSQELREDLLKALGQQAMGKENPAADNASFDPNSAYAEDLRSNEVFLWYEALNLPPFAPLHQVKRRYRALAKKYHPDARSGLSDSSENYEEKMKRINQAYESIIRHTEQTGC